MKTGTLLAAAVAAQISLVCNARTFDFSEGKWDRGEFFEARNDDWNRGDPIVQMPDCIMNANKPEWSDEELFKNHQAEVYSSLVLTNRFRGDITFSSRMSFDHRMAPSLVIAGEFAKDAHEREGRGVEEAALLGADRRFRAVMMTAWSFLFGVLPLVFATGAGAGSQRGIGITTFSGMLAATFVGVCFTPALYALFQKIRESVKGMKKAPVLPARA